MEYLASSSRKSEKGSRSSSDKSGEIDEKSGSFTSRDSKDQLIDKVNTTRSNKCTKFASFTVFIPLNLKYFFVLIDGPDSYRRFGSKYYYRQMILSVSIEL